jgi:hypothetical protein
MFTGIRVNIHVRITKGDFFFKGKARKRWGALTTFSTIIITMDTTSSDITREATRIDGELRLIL